MSERLVFGCGTQSPHGEAPGTRVQSAAQAAAVAPAAVEPPSSRRPAAAPERRDWGFIGLLTFTGLLFFRPQDQIHVLEALHLAEVSALAALAAMVAGRLRRGQGVTRMTPELAGVVALGAIILATAPFSIWRGG